MQAQAIIKKIQLNVPGKLIAIGDLRRDDLISVLYRSSRKDKIFDQTIGHLQDIIIGVLLCAKGSPSSVGVF